MHTKKSTRMYKLPSSISSWNDAIAEAERLAREAKASATRLRATARQFRRLQSEGAPFPGSKLIDGNPPSAIQVRDT